MRSTVRYAAGLMIAAGAVLAFSSPAAAAPQPGPNNTPTYGTYAYSYQSPKSWAFSNTTSQSSAVGNETTVNGAQNSLSFSGGNNTNTTSQSWSNSGYLY